MEMGTPGRLLGSKFVMFTSQGGVTRVAAFGFVFAPLLISDIIIHCTHDLSSHWLTAYS